MESGRDGFTLELYLGMLLNRSLNFLNYKMEIILSLLYEIVLKIMCNDVHHSVLMAP